MKKTSLPLIAVLSFLSLAACNEKVPTLVHESWLGKWNGPEGTFLNIDKDEAGYHIIIQDLDGPASFTAKEVPEGLSFQRGGVTEIIQPGNGLQTGMKWLNGKKNCLIVKAGEGYCRD